MIKISFAFENKPTFLYSLHVGLDYVVRRHPVGPPAGRILFLQLLLDGKTCEPLRHDHWVTANPNKLSHGEHRPLLVILNDYMCHCEQHPLLVRLMAGITLWTAPSADQINSLQVLRPTIGECWDWLKLLGQMSCNVNSVLFQMQLYVSI